MLVQVANLDLNIPYPKAMKKGINKIDRSRKRRKTEETS